MQCGRLAGNNTLSDIYQKNSAGLRFYGSGKGVIWGWTLLPILLGAWEPRDIAHIQQVDWRKGRSIDSAEMRNQVSSGKPFPALCYPLLCSSTALLPVAWSHDRTPSELLSLKSRGWLVPAQAKPCAQFIEQMARWLVGSKGGLLRKWKHECVSIWYSTLGHSSVSAGYRAVCTSLALAYWRPVHLRP